MADRYVVDTGPLMEGYVPPEGSRCMIPPEVLEELEDHGVTHFEILERGLVTTFPGKGALTIVRDHASGTGDLDVLSDADIAALALAGEHQAVLVTDDYAVQNVASVLGVETQPFSQEGISRTITWVWYCPGCKVHEGTQKGRCPICDTELKRRPAD